MLKVCFCLHLVLNRKLQIQHDLLVDQISFLSLDRPSLDGCSVSTIGLVPNLSVDLDRTLTRDEDKFFDSDEDVPSVKEKMGLVDDNEKLIEGRSDEVESLEKELEQCKMAEIMVQTEMQDSEQVNSVEQELEFNAQLLQNENEESGPLTSTPMPNKQVEQKSQEVQTPPFALNTKRKKRSSMLSVKRTKKPIIIPVLPGQRLVPVISEDMVEENLQV